MSGKAVLCIDIQNDFCPGGALAVTSGDEIIPVVNQMMQNYRAAGDFVILTQDWHPADHKSFASQHEDHNPFEMVDMPYGAQTLWPDHCVQGSNGAEFHKDLATDLAQMIIRKGYNRDIDSYSAFFENDQKTPTGLHGFLQNHDIKKLEMVGLATDFCVAFSALDAARLGYQVSVKLDACRAIDLEGSLDAQLNAMRQAGIALTS